MLKKIRNILPATGIVAAVANFFADICLVRKYKKKYGMFIVRKGTSDYAVLRAVFFSKEFRLPIKMYPSLIVDLGAYTGLSAIYYAETYPGSTIMCVEPEDSNFETLLQNTEHLDNVTTIKAGVWSKEIGLKVMGLYNKNGFYRTGFSVEEAKEGEGYDVWGITVDSILGKSGFNTIDILKIDIEGAEKQVFSEGVEKWIDKVNVIVIELHDRFVKGCSEAFYNAIDAKKWIEHKNREKVVMVRKTFV